MAVAAGSVEPLYRVGATPSAVRELGLIGFVREYGRVIDDAVSMATRLGDSIGDLLGQHVDSGPVVGVGRLGGDADLVVDGRLIEVKCTVNARSVVTRALQQLLVYSARLRPTSISLLLPRQAIRVDLSLDGLDQVLATIDGEIQLAYA